MNGDKTRSALRPQAPDVNNRGNRGSYEESGVQAIEGWMLQHRGHDKLKVLWKSRYVVLNLGDGGTISCYKSAPTGSYGNRGRNSAGSKKVNFFSSLLSSRKKGDAQNGAGDGGAKKPAKSRRASVSVTEDAFFEPPEQPRLFIPADVPWVLRDAGNKSTFYIEVPCTSDGKMDERVKIKRPGLFDMKRNDVMRQRESVQDALNKLNLLDLGDISDSDDESNSEKKKNGGETATMSRRDSDFSNLTMETNMTNMGGDDVLSVDGTVDGTQTKGKRKRFTFKCPGKEAEKAMWIRAAMKLDRLSEDSKTSKKGLLGMAKTKRVRSDASAKYSNRVEKMDRRSVFQVGQDMFHLQQCLSVSDEPQQQEHEYRVRPEYAYPRRWMTKDELVREMVRTSDKFHDLRIQSSPGDARREIGTVRLEVLECAGLPKLDRLSKTDAVCYVVCGSCAFTTDVIDDSLNPMWLRKTRRACILPIYHAYAQIFVAVFDDDGENEDDDLAGRVVLDVARLRPGCLYDVTFPLRMSSHVYTRRPRGCIRLRVQLDWYNERAAVLSYLPKDVTELKSRLKGGTPVTIQCADNKALRNIALTVRGSTLPGRYTQKIHRATMREFKLFRKLLEFHLKYMMKAIMTWVQPAVSAYVFLGWMHCVYSNSFAWVPPYVVSCVLMYLMYNYARYTLDMASHGGYASLTFEELLGALAYGGSSTSENHMRSLAVSSRGVQSGERPLLLASHSTLDLSSCDAEHLPLGADLFRQFGFSADHVDHMEFPFSDYEKYPKIPLTEAIVRSKKSGTKEDPMSSQSNIELVDSYDTDEYDMNDDEEYDGDDGGSLLSGDDGHGRKKTIVNGIETTAKAARVLGSEAAHTGLDALKYSFRPVQATQKDQNPKKQGIEKFPSTRSLKLSALAVNAPNAVESRKQTSVFRSGSANKCTEAWRHKVPELPEQNIDVRVQSKNLQDELKLLHQKAQKMSLRLFDDRICVINHPDTQRSVGKGLDEKSPSFRRKKFGRSKSTSDRNMAYEDARRVSDEAYVRDLEKHLGIHAHSNPVIAKVSGYIAPIMSIIQTGLSGARAVFNLFLWKDPYLSFWACLFCVFLIILLIVWPWRLFFFVVGVGALGPQNWFLRLAKEKKEKGGATKQNGIDKKGGTEPRGNAPSSPRSSVALEVAQGKPDKPPQAVFASHCHTSGGKRKAQDMLKAVRGEVVVPYSALRSNRFYDWPPEPSASKVTPSPMRSLS